MLMVWLLLFFLTHRDLRDSFLLVLVCFMILCIIRSLFTTHVTLLHGKSRTAI
jgi:hypothetical protein